MTNCICLVIFLILNGGLFINAILVFVAGSSNRLMNGTDFRAEICGVDQRADRPYLYYIEPTVDTNVAICVSNCPNSTVFIYIYKFSLYIYKFHRELKYAYMNKMLIH